MEIPIEKFKKACKTMDGDLVKSRNYLVCETEDLTFKLNERTGELKIIDHQFGLQRWGFVENIFVASGPILTAEGVKEGTVIEFEFKNIPSYEIKYVDFLGFAPSPLETPEEKLSAVAPSLREKYKKIVERARYAAASRQK